jgi:hypothetical protein
MWMDYNIIQAGNNFKIEGDWPGEVMGFSKDGKSKDRKENPLYRPGDVFIVNESGWLVKTDEVNALLLKHESTQKTQSQQHDQNT